MKRLLFISLAIVLVISCAVPAGAVFASTEIVEVAQEGNVVDDESVVLEDSQDYAKTEDTEGKGQEKLDDTSPISPIPPPLPDLVIAQLQIGAKDRPNDEYIAVYNNGSVTVDVTGWCIRSVRTSVVPIACFDEPGVDYEIGPRAYGTLSSMGDVPGGAMVWFGGGIVASDNTIELVDAEEEPRVVNSISWKNRPVSLQYGYVEPLIECADGRLVISSEQCAVVNMCQGIQLSEIAANADEQFIEIYNPGDSHVILEGCQIMTNRSAKSYVFSEYDFIESGGYKIVFIATTELTLTKTTTGMVYIVSSDGKTEIDSVEYSSLAKDTSWARIGGTWHQTYTLTPNTTNVYQQYLPCDEGYWRNIETGRCNRVIEVAGPIDCGEGRERNPTTGRCRNSLTVRELAPCREGQYRNEETNRCRSIATAANALKPCADDQFRNPATNRCKKIASSDDVALADCGEGRERNPTTNRCRDIVSSVPPAAGFAVEPIKDAANIFVGWWVLGGVTVLALGYAGWEWREEVSRFVRKLAQIGRTK
ncbi:hypothetical protein B7Z00_05110 [Candidatus Saccharibacteria bacterium 32-50-10]|nr:MAG: hypothetical protein B7Z00_05110 [Candidatus Saccharibacteria bacterium 32-50-10]